MQNLDFCKANLFKVTSYLHISESSSGDLVFGKDKEGTD